MDTQSLMVLVDPRIRSAYFNDYLIVAKAELLWLLGQQEISHQKIGEMDFFHFDAPVRLTPKIAALSCVHGVFEAGPKAEQLKIVSENVDYLLHDDFVFGSKYRGKTNEFLTQLLITIGRISLGIKAGSKIKLLDPMCGRGTTLFWSMQYGMDSKGIEQDPGALGDVQQIIKKWTKIHSQKHSLKKGSTGNKKKKNSHSYITFQVGENAMQLVNGDSANTSALLGGEKFDLLVSDLPYGIHHTTTKNTRNPLETITACAKAWTASLKEGGVMALSFNSYLPSREQLLAQFTDLQLEVLPFSAPHRVSESILRDIVLLQKKMD